MRRRWSIGFGAAALVAAHCSSPSERGDETHFWCSANEDCLKHGPHLACVDSPAVDGKKECLPAADAGAPGAGGGGSSGDGPDASSGGDTASTGGTSSGGGAQTSNTGGTSSNTGGTSSNTGGTSSNTGGTSSNTGGTSSNTGGTSSSGALDAIAPDASPGPVADCNNSPWPANLAAFETTASRVSREDSLTPWPYDVAINRNGTAIVAAYTNEQRTAYGTLVRWVGDTVTSLGQPSGSRMTVNAVSCDGMTIAGNSTDTASPGVPPRGVPMRWTNAGGFETLARLPASSESQNGTYVVSSTTPDGATFNGTYAAPGETTRVVRWSGGTAQVLFALPDATSVISGWSGDGTTLLGSDGANKAFLRTMTGPIQYLGIANVDSTRALSYDGTVATGTFPSQTTSLDDVTGFVWSSGQPITSPPVRYIPQSVTPDRVVHGFQGGIPDGVDLGEFIWDAKHGLRDLRTILAANGVTIPDAVHIITPLAVSADHRVFVLLCTDDNDQDVPPQLCRGIVPANTFD